MKNLILTAALVMGLTATVSRAGPVEDCYLASSVLFDLAKVRDAGFGPEVAFNALTNGGMEPDFAVVLLEIVYISGIHLSPKEIKEAAFAGCIAELAQDQVQ